MKVFLSWSGAESHALAMVLHEWLPGVLPSVDPWMSSEDIAKGQRWAEDMGEILEDSAYCIVCVTPGVEREPWVNFEAGAVSKIVKGSRVSPLLLGLSVEDLSNLPLAMFQCTTCDKDDVLKLLRSIAAAGAAGRDAKRIDGMLDKTWGWFSDQVDRIPVTASVPPTSEADKNDAVDDETLDHEEEQILTILAARFPEPVYESALVRAIRIPPLRLRYHLDRLEKSKLLENPFFEDEGLYELTAAGRRLVVDHGLDP
ncbi:MAG: toll/interleukin-1 receptor domain-containing protein [Gemmatimonadetes bacterium]|nr:toll/interleukin-1 receptor domain-containing protein [Candidatus Palauibacter rhopaloidicola]